MLTEAQRLQQVVSHIDNLLVYMVKMPLSFMKCRRDAETFTQHMVSMRAMALGHSPEKTYEVWLGWIERRYPDLKDPIARSITQACLVRFPQDEVARDGFYKAEIAKLVQVMKEMGKEG